MKSPNAFKRKEFLTMNLKEIVTLNDNREIYYALLDFTQKLAQNK